MSINNTEEVVLSVCTITYKHAEFIKDTIDGVLKQEVNFPIELIIADDNSPDNTENIVKEYIENHPKGNLIKYTKHPENKGMMGNFIWALEQCKGKYIALCEGDDYWIDPTKLQKQVDFLEANKEYIASFHKVKVVNSKGDVIRENKFSNSNLHDYPSYMLMEGKVIPTLANVFRNVMDKIPFEFEHSGVGDKFLSSFLGTFGDAKYMSNIAAGAYRVGNHGIWYKKNQLYQKKLNLTTVFQLWRFHERIGNQKIADNLLNNLAYQGYKLLPHTKKTMFIEKVEVLILKVNYLIFGSLKKFIQLLIK